MRPCWHTTRLYVAYHRSTFLVHVPFLCSAVGLSVHFSPSSPRATNEMFSSFILLFLSSFICPYAYVYAYIYIYILKTHFKLSILGIGYQTCGCCLLTLLLPLRWQVPDAKPLFFYLPWQNVHAPYQAPNNWTGDVLRGMLSATDAALGNVVITLKAKGMWDNTVLFYCADNGGTDRGSNWPLRGSKHSNWEGGMRASKPTTPPAFS